MKNLEEKYMKLALKEAKKALLYDEVPIGAIIVKNGKVISRGYNRREKEKSIVSHAEINAIKKAEKKLGDWQLIDCELYVTLEPCPMCSGAIYQSRIKKIYFGAYDLKQGAIESAIKLFDIKTLNFHPLFQGGILEEECKELIQSFFRNKRKK